jgi:hypothetical protein
MVHNFSFFEYVLKITNISYQFSEEVAGGVPWLLAQGKKKV